MPILSILLPTGPVRVNAGFARNPSGRWSRRLHHSCAGANREQCSHQRRKTLQNRLETSGERLETPEARLIGNDQSGFRFYKFGW